MRPWKLPCLWILVATVACGDPQAKGAQLSDDSLAVVTGDSVIIDGAAPSCTSCTLALIDSTQLGDPRDAELPQRVPALLRDSRGNYYMTFHGWGDKPILRYDSSGRFIGTLGTTGNGPGEYTMTSAAFAGPADSMFVFGNSRLQVFAPDSRYARGVHLTRVRPLGSTPDGILFADRSKFPSDSMINNHVVRITDGGIALDSFRIFSATKRQFLTANGGGRMPVVNTRLESVTVYAPDGTVWTFSSGNLRFEHHASDGRSLRLLGLSLPERSTVLMTTSQADSVAEEMRSATSGQQVISTQPRPMPPRPSASLGVSTRGDLWLMRLVAAPRWDTITVSKQHLSPDEAPLEETIAPNDDDRRYHTIVEVIEPGTARLLARAELPFKGLSVAPGFIGRVRQHDDGHYIVTVYTLRLTGGSPAKR